MSPGPTPVPLPSVWHWLTFHGFQVCPVIVAGFLFGLYTGCFVLYLYLHAMKTLKASDAKRNFLIYLLCTLYGLSAVNAVFNVLAVFGLQPSGGVKHSILIYRCWIVWGRRTSVIIIPLLLALAALGTSLSQIGFGQALYLAIDGLVMGLIILKIVMVYLGVRPVMAHSGRENKFRPLVFILFILVESGSVIFVTRLCSIILSFEVVHSAETLLAEKFFVAILTQVPLNGIIPTIILVREALGMSYSDVTPSSQTIESLHFADNDDTSGNSNQEVEPLDAQASDAQDIVEVNRSSTP
ncbi:hypothetical protein BYT27DRAFT_7337858 [Phlegmacium glaucopus]|nr:hypothetical protein BYT27DRAFT_7337858 [Phlegmacium glaucopus]